MSVRLVYRERLDLRTATLLPVKLDFTSETRPKISGEAGQKWFRDLDSNQDTQLQRLMSYQLDDPGSAGSSLAEARKLEPIAGTRQMRRLTLFLFPMRPPTPSL
jgi:hypothetical protein